MSTDFTVETVTTLAGLESLRDDYAKVLAAMQNALPFRLHAWHLSWWNHLRRDSASASDSLAIQVARRPDGTCVGIVPFVRTDWPGRGPIRLRALRLLGADAYLTEVRTLLLDPSCEAQVARAVLEHLEKAGGWHWAHWTGIRPGSSFAEVLAEKASIRWTPGEPTHVLELAPTWEEFRKALKRNIRESLRHCYNSLKRDGHEFQLEIAKEPDEVGGALDHFLRLHTARSLMQNTIPHPDRFASDKARAFLRDIVMRMASTGQARVFTLRIGGAPVAARVGFVVGDSLYLYFSGYDPAWKKYSVMTTTIAEAIKYAIGAGLKTVDLSAGTDVAKTRWGAKESPFSEAVQVRGSLVAHGAYEAYRLAINARVSVAARSAAADQNIAEVAAP